MAVQHERQKIKERGEEAIQGMSISKKGLHVCAVCDTVDRGKRKEKQFRECHL